MAVRVEQSYLTEELGGRTSLDSRIVESNKIISDYPATSHIINTRPAPTAYPTTAPIIKETVIQPTATAKTTAMTTKTVKVLDETGAPLPGANVYFSATNGTTTDFDGLASLSNTDPTKVVTISYMGFNSQSFRLQDLPSVVRLVPGETLGEVIITAPSPKKGLPKYVLPALGGIALLLILMSMGSSSPKEVTL